MGQVDKAKKKAAAKDSGGWDRHRMTETHRKGKRAAKKQVARARRRLDKVVTGDGKSHTVARDHTNYRGESPTKS